MMLPKLWARKKSGLLCDCQAGTASDEEAFLEVGGIAYLSRLSRQLQLFHQSAAIVHDAL